MRCTFSILSFQTLAALLASGTTAHAYIGPSIVIGAVGSMFGWVAAVAVAALIVLSYPFYLLYRRKNSRKQSKAEDKAPTAEPAQTPEAAVSE